MLRYETSDISMLRRMLFFAHMVSMVSAPFRSCLSAKLQFEGAVILF